MARLIEKNFPYAQLSAVAEAESWRKEIHRPIYYIHKWWARRLGSVFRGLILSSCLDEQEDFWGRFYGKNDLSGTVIFDPFMGSGVTIGEAIKLGCNVIGRDINQVSYLVCRAAFAKYDVAGVLSTYREIESAISAKLLQYFETQTESGEIATVLYYFLVKTIPCPQCGEGIALFKSRIFSKNAVPRKDPAAHALCPGCESINTTSYNSRTTACPSCKINYNPQHGTIRGARVQCDKCNHVFRLVEHLKKLGHPLEYRRYAKMILTASGKKEYSSMNAFDHALEARVRQDFSALAAPFPSAKIAPGYNTNQILKHNYCYWHELFSDRQLLCIYHLREAIRKIRQQEHRLLFSCLFSGVLEFNNLFASFKGEGTGAVRHMFSNHILKPEMMPIEANIWGTRKSSGSFSTLFRHRIMRALAYKENPTEILVKENRNTRIGAINFPVSVPIVEKFSSVEHSNKFVFLSQGDSSYINIPNNAVDVVVTDPPFFDNVHYSPLADFFYYWLNQVLDYSPENTTRQEAEVQDTNSLRFTAKLTSIFSECNRILADQGLLVFSYHHARQEGWISVHRAIRHAGFVCEQVYPIKAEMSVSMPLKQSKSPIHLDLIFVCNKENNGAARSSERASLKTALQDAQTRVADLTAFGLSISLGDAKAILMGCLLREAHRIRNLEKEEEFLSGIEKCLETCVAEVIRTKGETLYNKCKSNGQMTLFEEIGNYLQHKSFQKKEPSPVLR